MTKYVYVDVTERDINTPMIFNTMAEAKAKMLEDFLVCVDAQDKLDAFYETRNYLKVYKSLYDDNTIFKLGDDGYISFATELPYAYATTKNHDNWDAMIYPIDI